MANGDTVKFGRLEISYQNGVGVSTGLISDLRSYTVLDYSSYIDIAIRNSSDYNSDNGNGLIPWIKFKLDGAEAYISKNLVLNYISYNDCLEFCNQNFIIDGNIYKLVLLTESQFISLPVSVGSQLYESYSSQSDISYIDYNCEDVNKIIHLNSSGKFYSEDSAHSSGYNGENMYYIPVIVKSEFDIIEAGMWRAVRDSDIIYRDNLYNFSDFDSYEYVWVQDYDSSKCSSPAKWIEYFYNGEKVYIPINGYINENKSRETMERYIQGLRTITIDGIVYEPIFMPVDFWINLPSGIISLLDNKIKDSSSYIYTSTKDESETSDTYYYLVSYNLSYDNFVTNGSIRYDSAPYDFNHLSVPIFVPRNKYKTVKFGTLSINGKTYAQENSSLPYYDSSFNFVDTVSDKEWEWIEMDYNDTKLYVCKTVAVKGATVSEYQILGDKELRIDNCKYKFKILTQSNLKDYNIIKLYNYCDLKYDNYENIEGGSYFDIKLANIYSTSGATTNYAYLDYDVRYNSFSSSGVNKDDYGYAGILPVLELISKGPSISGVDSNLGDKTSAFSIEYSVDDQDSEDTLTVSCKLNGTIYNTINNAVRNQKYNFDITTSMFANLTINATNTIEIVVNDGTFSATRTYTFRKTNTAPVINYTGSDNLGIINSKPTIRYTVTDAEGDDIIITERLNGKVLQTYTVSSGTECTVNIPNMSWLGCGNSTNTIEINARDSAGGSNNKTITFTRAIDRIEVITNPIKTDKAVTKISLEVGWNTENASGQVFVCNNAYDASPTWENMTNSVGSNLVYNLTNTTKTAAEWGVSVKVIVKKDGGSTGEVSLYNIKGTYE